MNLPNLLTLSRIPLLFVIVGLLYAIELPFVSTLALLVFIAASITDFLDGYYARKLNIVSNFGKLMDALTDKILIVGLFIALLSFGILPHWTLVLLLLVVCREFLITGLRLVAAANGQILAAEKSGKQKTVSQIISVICLLLAEFVRYDLTRVVSADLSAVADWVDFAGLFFFCVAAVLTIYSGTKYLVKYWDIFLQRD